MVSSDRVPPAKSYEVKDPFVALWLSVQLGNRASIDIVGPFVIVGTLVFTAGEEFHLHQHIDRPALWGFTDDLGLWLAPQACSFYDGYLYVSAQHKGDGQFVRFTHDARSNKIVQDLPITWAERVQQLGISGGVAGQPFALTDRKDADGEKLAIDNQSLLFARRSLCGEVRFYFEQLRLSDILLADPFASRHTKWFFKEMRLSCYDEDRGEHRTANPTATFLVTTSDRSRGAGKKEEMKPIVFVVDLVTRELAYPANLLYRYTTDDLMVREN